MAIDPILLQAANFPANLPPIWTSHFGHIIANKPLLGPALVIGENRARASRAGALFPEIKLEMAISIEILGHHCIQNACRHTQRHGQTLSQGAPEELFPDSSNALGLYKLGIRSVGSCRVGCYAR